MVGEVATQVNFDARFFSFALFLVAFACSSRGVWLAAFSFVAQVRERQKDKKRDRRKRVRGKNLGQR